MTPTRWKRAVNATAQLDFGQLLPALTQAWPRGTRPASPEAHNWQIRAPLCTPDSRDPAAPIRRSAYVKVRIRLTVGDQHCLRGRTAPGRGSIHPVSQERSPVAGWHLRHSAPGESDCEPDHVSCRARRTLDETCCPGICGCHMRGAKRAPVRRTALCWVAVRVGYGNGVVTKITSWPRWGVYSSHDPCQASGRSRLSGCRQPCGRLGWQTVPRSQPPEDSQPFPTCLDASHHLITLVRYPAPDQLRSTQG
jgi:hypothetical protein